MAHEVLSFGVETICVSPTCCTWHTESNPGIRGHPRIAPHNKWILHLNCHRLPTPIRRPRQNHQGQHPLPQILMTIPQVIEICLLSVNWCIDATSFRDLYSLSIAWTRRSSLAAPDYVMLGEPVKSLADPVQCFFGTVCFCTVGTQLMAAGQIIPVVALGSVQLYAPGWGHVRGIQFREPPHNEHKYFHWIRSNLYYTVTTKIKAVYSVVTHNHNDQIKKHSYAFTFPQQCSV
jgi:hypothetical protein